MCKKIRNALMTKQTFLGSFLKGNEPEESYISVFLAPCQCDEKVFARIASGQTWVEIHGVLA